MGADQCDKPSGDQCLESHCQSGVAQDGECDPEMPFSCPLGVTDSEGLVFDDYKIHWLCYDSTLDKVNVYTKTEAPGGTICTTDHK